MSRFRKGTWVQKCSIEDIEGAIKFGGWKCFAEYNCYFPLGFSETCMADMPFKNENLLRNSAYIFTWCTCNDFMVWICWMSKHMSICIRSCARGRIILFFVLYYSREIYRIIDAAGKAVIGSVDDSSLTNSRAVRRAFSESHLLVIPHT